MSNLEFRNGYSGTAAGSFLSVQVGAFINMTDVTIRNMYSTTSTAAVMAVGTTGPQARGRFLRVNFIDCSAAAGAASVLSLANPVEWILEDVAFLNCSNGASSYFAIKVEVSATSSMTFGGNIVFNASSGAAAAAMLFTGSTSYNFSIYSRPSNPSKFSVNTLPSFFILSNLNLYLESYQLTHMALDTGGVPLTFFIQGSSVVALKIVSDLRVDGARILSNSVANLTLDVGGSIVSTSCQGTYAFSASNLTSITASEIIVSDAVYGVFYCTGSSTNLNVRTTNDVRLTGLSDLSITSANAVTANCGLANFQIGGDFIISRFTVTSAVSGAGVLVDSDGRATISAQNVAINGCKAYQGGAAAVTSNGSLTISATKSVVFENNIGVLGGGALYLSNTSTFGLNAPVVNFISNEAPYGSAAMLGSTAQMASFSRSNFHNNKDRKSTRLNSSH